MDKEIIEIFRIGKKRWMCFETRPVPVKSDDRSAENTVPDDGSRSKDSESFGKVFLSLYPRKTGRSASKIAEKLSQSERRNQEVGHK